MEDTYIYGNVLVIHSESTERVGIFHKWKYFPKRRSYIIRLNINTSLFFSKKHFSLFSRIKLLFFFSLLQATKLNRKRPTTLQQLTRTKAVTYSSQIIVQLSFSKINSLLSANTILSR